MNISYPILSFVIWVPIIAGLIVLVIGDRRLMAARLVALLGAIVGLLVALPLWIHFDRGAGSFQEADSRATGVA